jgi:hypothetical protein
VDPELLFATVADVILDPGRLVSEDQGHFAKPGALEDLQLVFEQRSVGDGEQWVGRMDIEGP